MSRFTKSAAKSETVKQVRLKLRHIDVISALKVGKSLHVSDLTVPAGIKIVDDASSTVCVVQQPKQAPDSAAAGAAEPELIRKPKPEDK